MQRFKSELRPEASIFNRVVFAHGHAVVIAHAAEFVADEFARLVKILACQAE